MRLLGIALASSGEWTKSYECADIPTYAMLTGLGELELTFLQLSTTYAPTSIAAHCIGCVGPHFVKHNVVDHHVQLLRFGNRCNRDCWCISLVGGPCVGRACGDGGVLGTSSFFLFDDFELFSYVLVPANALHILTYHFLLPSPSSSLSVVPIIPRRTYHCGRR